MAEYIDREAVLAEYDRQHKGPPGGARKIMETYPAADVVARDCYDRVLAENDAMRAQLAEIGKKPGGSMEGVMVVPDGGIGEMSDGFHTFNGLYYQRMILTAALVKAYKGRAWKSYRHEDGEQCFGGGWFIVGIDTPEGQYTYHYESKDFDLFDCVELSTAPHWDGHTEKDVTRLLSLPDVPPVGNWFHVKDEFGDYQRCSNCGKEYYAAPLVTFGFCPNCGAKMGGMV